MNSKTQLTMLIALLLLSVGVGFFLYRGESSTQTGHGQSNSRFKPGIPKIEHDPSIGSPVPSWKVTGIFENGMESRRWGRAEFVWPDGKRMVWHGESHIERRSMCGMTVEYFEGQATTISATRGGVVVGLCEQQADIDFTQILAEVMNDPMNHPIPYSAFDVFTIEVSSQRMSPVAFGVELRMAYLQGQPLEFVSTVEEVRQDSILRFEPRL